MHIMTVPPTTVPPTSSDMNLEPAADGSIAVASVQRVNEDDAQSQADALAVEEPLEIRLGYDDPLGERTRQSISVTMRTPGQDAALALGFLFSEGVVEHPSDVARIRRCRRVEHEAERGNVINVELERGVSFDAERLERHFYATSSCGVCGKASIEAVGMAACPTLPTQRPLLTPALIRRLPEALRESQSVFKSTGGLHAAALFDSEGTLYQTSEDIGRHNAVDKLVGHCLMEGKVPLSDFLLLVSGRASFELTQKALMAGIPVMAAVSAPSSLAVKLARQFDMTLLGFVRSGRFNVYSDAGRLRTEDGSLLVDLDAKNGRGHRAFGEAQ